MHNIMHTARPHACTREQQQQFNSSSSSSRDSSDDGDVADSGINGKFAMISVAAFNNINSEAFAAATHSSRQLVISCRSRMRRRRNGFSSAQPVSRVSLDSHGNQ